MEENLPAARDERWLKPTALYGAQRARFHRRRGAKIVKKEAAGFDSTLARTACANDLNPMFPSALSREARRRWTARSLGDVNLNRAPGL